MNDFERTAAPPPEISTRAELRKHEAERARPAATRACTPGGAITEEISSAMAKLRERRIAHLQAALEGAHARFENDHSFARLPGHSKAHFARSR